MNCYTAEVYKASKRIKQTEGRYFNKAYFIINVFETYVERMNIVLGKLYKERYDTPNFFSPSFVSY